MNKGFEIFFREKRIDLMALKSERKEFYEELESLYEMLGPQSFDQQKKFIFNPLRLEFPLDLPIEDPGLVKKSKTSLKKPLLKRPTPKPKTEGASATKKSAPVRPLMKKPLMQKGNEGPREEEPIKDKNPVKKKPIMKRPIMNKSTQKEKELTQAENKNPKKKKKTQLKKPIMKPQQPEN